MKKSYVVFLLLFFAAAFASGHSDNAVDNPVESQDFFPLDDAIEILLEEKQYDQVNDPFSESPEAIILTPPNLAMKKMETEETPPSFLEVDIKEELASISTIDTMKEEAASSIQTIEINLRQVFSGSPIIYILLFILSTASVCIWLYSMLTIRSVDFLPSALVKDLRSKLVSNQFDNALDLCVKQNHFFCKILASGILARKHGLSVMIDTMKAEGKRSTVAFWQKINILNEIAIIAPMLGLLGTVLGMFYAFYDLNRSIESVSLLFDGLGISVGTTVAGLFVAILATILYSVAKYRLVRILATVENEAQSFATLIDNRSKD